MNEQEPGEEKLNLPVSPGVFMSSFSVQAESRSAEGESRPHSRAKNNEKETKLSVKNVQPRARALSSALLSRKPPHTHTDTRARKTFWSVPKVHRSTQGEVKQTFPS